MSGSSFPFIARPQRARFKVNLAHYVGKSDSESLQISSLLSGLLYLILLSPYAIISYECIKKTKQEKDKQAQEDMCDSLACTNSSTALELHVKNS